MDKAVHAILNVVWGSTVCGLGRGPYGKHQIWMPSEPSFTKGFNWRGVTCKKCLERKDEFMKMRRKDQREKLKSVALVLCLSLLISACGGSGGGDSATAASAGKCQSVAGLWRSCGGLFSAVGCDDMAIAADCSGTTLYCGYTFNYVATGPNTSDVTITAATNSTDAVRCLPPGQYACTTPINSGSMFVTCGGISTLTYVKQ